MGKFLYQGLTAGGREVSGEIEASSREEAAGRLHDDKIRSVKIRGKGAALNLRFGGRVGLKDLSRFTRKFASMVTAGLPITECLGVLADDAENKGLGAAVRAVAEDIQGGSHLAEALGKHPRIFNPLYCNMVASGEASGHLSEVLLRLAKYQEKSNTTRRKIVSAMTYPLILAVAVIAATAILLGYVVPTFADMFTSMGSALPGPTQFVLAISGLFSRYGLIVLVLVLLLVIAVARYHRTEHGALTIDRLVLAAPVVGNLARKGSVSRFSQTLSTLLASGVNILESLEITAKTAGNKVLEKGLLAAHDRITAGEALAAPLGDIGVFPKMVTHMVAVGERTGDLPAMLDKVAEFYEEEVDAAVETLTAMLEPALIVVMGIVIGGILVAMYLPMFDIISAIG